MKNCRKQHRSRAKSPKSRERTYSTLIGRIESSVLVQVQLIKTIQDHPDHSICLEWPPSFKKIPTGKTHVLKKTKRLRHSSRNLSRKVTCLKVKSMLLRKTKWTNIPKLDNYRLSLSLSVFYHPGGKLWTK